MSQRGKKGRVRSADRQIAVPSSALSTLVNSEEIVEILNKKRTGFSKDYDILIQRLNDPSVELKYLRQYIQSLANCTSHLTKEFDTLVGTVVALPWTDYDEETVLTFMEFFTHLLSSQAYYLPACLKSIFNLFFPVFPPGCLPQDIELSGQDKRFNYAHEALKVVIKIVPSAPKFLPEIFSKYFPYMRKARIFHECYIINLLRITEYLPVLRLSVLLSVIDHLNKIDVEIPKHELEEEGDDEEETQFEVDMETTDSCVTNETEEMKHELAASLDACMLQLFQFLHKTSHPQGQLDVPSASLLFKDLKQVFEKVILPTHASHHVQFVMFYMCSFSQSFMDQFLNFLWKKVTNPNTPSILRQATAAYIASVAARAKFATTRTVMSCMDLMKDWIHSYIDAQDGSIVIPNVDRHGPFYSMCQALFYIIVFRHNHLLQTTKGIHYLRNLNLERIINCRLNPLKVCLPSVVNMFATITRHYEIVFCYTIIDRNSRSIIPISSSNRSKAISQLTLVNPLDSFFPFDPYLLNRSGHFIKPIYQEWEGIHPEDENDNQAHEQDLEEEEFMQYGKTPEQAVPMGTTPTSPSLFGVSPGFGAL